jgi:hypothetical protein
MAESSCCFRNCSRNSVRRMVLVTGLYPLYGADEVSGEVVIVKSLWYILLLMVPEQVWDWHVCSYRCVFFDFRLFFVSLCLVLSVASWGSVSLAVSSSSWEWRFLYSFKRYFFSATWDSLADLIWFNLKNLPPLNTVQLLEISSESSNSFTLLFVILKQKERESSL